MSVDYAVLWPTRITKMMEVKSLLNDVDGGFWPYHLPATAATEAQVQQVEAKIGWSLPRDYQTFLMCANGWRGFFQEIDLLSCAQLVGSDHLSMYNQMYLEAFTTEDWRNVGLSSDSLLPVGVTLRDRDVFVIDKSRSTRDSAAVTWLAGEVIDQWDDFASFFRSMIEYNRQEISRFSRADA